MDFNDSTFLKVMGDDIKAAGARQGIENKIEKNLFNHIGIAFNDRLHICIPNR